MLKGYTVARDWKIYTVEVIVQVEDYKGKILKKLKANVGGFNLIKETVRDIQQEFAVKSNCEFTTSSDKFTCKLKDKKGNILVLEDSLENLNGYVVKAEIVKIEEV